MTDWRGRSAALYGRFTLGARERIAEAITAGGGKVARDLTGRSDALVVGALATSLIDTGHLGARLASAAERSMPVFSERRFEALLRGDAGEAPSLPLTTVLRLSHLTPADVHMLAAFEVVRVANDCCRFGDAATLKTASEIIAAGRTLGDCVRILVRARDLAPKGRRSIVIDDAGRAALAWEDGRTTLEGQGFLPFDEAAASVEDLFEAAVLAEAEGDLEEAARLYDMCARADRRDAIALFNLGNVHLELKAYDKAILAYGRAVSRDPDFVEAHYNLAQACEAVRQYDRARAALAEVLARDARHADALFNLAQIDLNAGDLAAAKARFEQYLAADPPSDWAEKARKAILYCTAKLSA